jgi:hypothetical protein
MTILTLLNTPTLLADLEVRHRDTPWKACATSRSAERESGGRDR